MNIKKIENIIQLENRDRYDYSIREFVKLEKIWAIYVSDSLLTFVDNVGDEIFPIWPHKEVAELCIFDEWKIDGYSIESIDYDNFKELCIPDMVDSSIMFGVFYNDKREGLAIEGGSLLEDLELEEEGDF